MREDRRQGVAIISEVTEWLLLQRKRGVLV